MTKKYQNFQKYSVLVLIHLEEVMFELSDQHGFLTYTNKFYLGKFSEVDWVNYNDSLNKTDVIFDFIQTQLDTINAYGLQVLEHPQLGKIVILDDYGLKGGLKGSQVLQVALSGAQILGGAALGPINPWLGSAFISSGFTTGVKALQNENCNTEEYLKTAGVAFTTGLVSGGFGLLGGFKWAVCGNAFSRPVGTAMQSLINQQPLPSSQELIQDFVIGGISGGVSNAASAGTSQLTRSALNKLVNPVRSTLAKVVTEGLTAATAGTSSQVTATVTENILYQRPITQDLTIRSLSANAFMSGAVGSLQTYILHRQTGKNVKVVLQSDDGNDERILWSGNEKDYLEFQIEEKLQALYGTMDIDEMVLKLAELTEQNSTTSKRKADFDMDEAETIKRIKRDSPPVPRDQWDRPITAKEIVVNGENVSVNQIKMAEYLSNVMACKLWGGDPAFHNPDAKKAMYNQFLEDQQGNPKRTYNRLVCSVSTFMLGGEAARVAKPLIAQYKANLPANHETVGYLNAVPQKNLIAQVYIEEIDEGLKTAGYKPLTRLQKTNLTLSLHEILEDTRTRDQEDSFIKVALAQTAGHFPVENIQAVESMFYKAEQTAKAIGQHEFQGLERKELGRVHGTSTLVVKAILQFAEEVVREILRQGFGLGGQTDGKQITPTAGVANQPNLVPIKKVEKKETFFHNPLPAHKESTTESVVLQAPIVSPIPLLVKPSPSLVKPSPSCGKPIEVNPPTEKPVVPATNDSTKPIGNKLNIKTTEKQKEKNKKGQEQWRNSKTGQFNKGPKDIPVHNNSFFNGPSGSLKREDSSAGIINNIHYVKPTQVNSQLELGLTQTTAVSAVHINQENGMPAFSVSAVSVLEVAKTEKSRLDLFPVTLGASFAEKEISLSAQVSIAKAQTTFESQPHCHKGSCTQTSLTLDLHLGSVGIKGGFGQKESKSGVKNTTVKAGVGLGLFGASTHVDVKTWKDPDSTSDINTELTDVLVQQKFK